MRFRKRLRAAGRTAESLEMPGLAKLLYKEADDYASDGAIVVTRTLICSEIHNVIQSDPNDELNYETVISHVSLEYNLTPEDLERRYRLREEYEDFRAVQRSLEKKKEYVELLNAGAITPDQFQSKMEELFPE